ncbi:APC family permease [Mesorhizobium sp. PAMC28654]|uniref:APC family permease n=1 Tax=Mesorhizobium sp. PAMC28654 TaxID=2880934 RepID=UPI001D0B739C|nr:APC family permease [Mesorhizobium sp. PAMC28654]UDL89370.1 APC family permease [Mesorhizobium sp. PAMC28654]
MSEPQKHLRSNSIGVLGLVFFVVAAVGPIGAVMGATPLVFMQSGTGASGIYLLAAVLFAVFSSGYVAMSRYVGTAGGFATYIARGFDYRTGGAAAYLTLFMYVVMVTSIYGVFAVFAAQAVQEYLGVSVRWEYFIAITLPIIAILSYTRVELSTRILGVLLIAEVFVILVLDFAIVFQGGNGGAPLDFSGFAPHNVFGGGLGLAFLFGLASFGGFEATVVFSEEAKDPKRTIPIATYAAVALIGVFYAFTTWALGNGAGAANIQQVATTDPTGFILKITETYVGKTWAHVISILAISSFLGVLLGFTNILSRYIFSMARVGLLPGFMALTHAKHQSPHRGSVVANVSIAVIIAGFIVAGADPFTTLYTYLLALGTVGLLAMLAAASLACVFFFMRNPRSESRWSTTIAPLLAFAGFCIATYLAISNFGFLVGTDSGWRLWLWLILPAVSILGYAVATLRGKEAINFRVAEFDTGLAPNAFAEPEHMGV